MKCCCDCYQGRAECPCPELCELAEDERPAPLFRWLGAAIGVVTAIAVLAALLGGSQW
jgi:hypothetical protein